MLLLHVCFCVVIVLPFRDAPLFVMLVCCVHVFVGTFEIVFLFIVVCVVVVVCFLFLMCLMCLLLCLIAFCCVELFLLLCI